MVTIILFAPLLGAILCGFGYRWLGEKGGDLVTATGLLFLACLRQLDRVLQLRRRDDAASRCSAGSSRARWRPTGACGSTG